MLLISLVLTSHKGPYLFENLVQLGEEQYVLLDVVPDRFVEDSV